MLLTGNFGLKKPELGEPVDVRDFNYNADIIDLELKKRPTANGDVSDMTVEFTEAKQLTELTSNDSLRGLFGKLKLTVKKVIEMSQEMVSLKKSVSDGKKLVADAITAQGVTTATDATFRVMADNITTVGANKYNEGVAAADGRVNTNSVNYQMGYNNGYAAGVAGKIPIYTGTVEIYIQDGYHTRSFTHPAANNVAIRSNSTNPNYNVYVESNSTTECVLGTHGIFGNSGTITVDWIVW